MKPSKFALTTKELAGYSKNTSMSLEHVIGDYGW